MKVRLHGRDREIAALAELRRAAAGGHLRVCLIEGEAGIGKTALLDHAAAEAIREGFSVCLARADEYRVRHPFETITEALDSGIARNDQDPRSARERLKHAAEGADAAGIQHRVQESLLELLESIALERPTILAIDGLHRSDRASLETIAAAIRGLRPLSIAMVLTFRPIARADELNAFIDLASDYAPLEIKLDPLDEPASVALMTDVIGSRPSPDLLARAEGATGNPFFLRELAAAHSDSEGGKESGERIDAPNHLQATIMRRIASLPSDLIEILRAVSVLGRPCSVEELATATGRAPAVLIPSLQHLVELRLFEETEGQLRIRHGLIREAIYEDMALPVRTAFHREIARALAARGAAPLDVAHHLVQAQHSDEETIGWLLSAARDVSSRAPDSAIALLDKALTLVGDDDNTVIEIEMELAELLAYSGDPRRAEEIIRGALDRKLGPSSENRLLQLLIHSLFVQGKWSDITVEVEKAMSFEGLSDQVRGRLLAESALARIWTGGIDAAASDAERAISFGERSNDPVAVCFGLGHLSVVADHRGEFTKGVDLAQKAVEVAGRDVPEAERRHPQIALGMALVAADRLEDAKKVLQEGRRMGERVGTVWDLPLYHAMLALPLFYLGQWDDCLTETETSLTVAEEVGPSVGAVTALSLRALILISRDDLEGAATSIDAAEAVVRRAGPQWGMVWLTLATAAAHEANGRSPEAKQVLEGAWQHAMNVRDQETKLRIGPIFVNAALGAGDESRAQEAASEVEKVAAYASVPYVSGTALLSRGLITGDPTTLGGAISHFRSSGREPEAGLAAEHTAVALARSREPEQARTHFHDCLTALARLDATRDQHRVLARMRSLGLRTGYKGPRARPSEGWDALTPSELKVIALAAKGLTNPQIGERLFISRRTVHAHLSHVFQKLGISSRVELAALVSRRQL
ncbi:MAG: AAA family ATPase [Actinomycetota bacterium]